MIGGIELLLLTALPLFGRCQQIPQVSMSPNLTQIFPGDFLYLDCNNGLVGSEVKWFRNDISLNRGRTFRIEAATTKKSGHYKCEVNGIKSENFTIQVLEYGPSASLTIETGHPVMQRQSLVHLKLETDYDMEQWVCKVMRMNNGKTQSITTIKLKTKDLKYPVTSFVFGTRLRAKESVYWCEHTTKQRRSNHVMIRTTAKNVFLEMDPFPAVTGEALTLSCMVHGTDLVTANFYQNDVTIPRDQTKSDYKIQIHPSDGGTYKCKATYKYRDQEVPDHQDFSDPQSVPLYDWPIKAELSDEMSCSCPRCGSDMSYQYYKKDGNLWKMMSSPDSSGVYQCRFVRHNMRTFPSRSVNYTERSSPVIIIMFAFISIVLIFALLLFYLKWRKRSQRRNIYEDLPMKRKDEGDPMYEMLPESAGGQNRAGEYESLSKGKGSEEVYHSLGDAAASGGGEGGYEALKKQTEKEVYHSLGDAAASGGGEGGYEALKKQTEKEVYHSLGDAAASGGGEGGYEALKKEGVQKEYETLKTKPEHDEMKKFDEIEILEKISEDKV